MASDKVRQPVRNKSVQTFFWPRTLPWVPWRKTEWLSLFGHALSILYFLEFLSSKLSVPKDCSIFAVKRSGKLIPRHLICIFYILNPFPNSPSDPLCTEPIFDPTVILNSGSLKLFTSSPPPPCTGNLGCSYCIFHFFTFRIFLWFHVFIFSF